MKLILLSVLVLAATVQITFASSEVHVIESCDKQDCTIRIVGDKSPCLESARNKTFSSGFEAAVSIRKCLDASAGKVASND